MSPDELRSGDTVTETWTRVPSFRTREVSYGWMCSPRSRRASTRSSSFGRSGRDDGRDRPAERLDRGIAVQTLGAPVPARDEAFERRAHDRVVGKLHDRRQVGQRRLVTLALRHDGGDRDAHHGHRAEERLQEQQRLVRRGAGERTEASHRAPDRRHRQERDRGRRLALTEAKRRPDQGRQAEEGQRLADESAEHEGPDCEQHREQTRPLEHAPSTARHFEALTPEHQQGTDDQRAHRVSEPPREPDRRIVAPAGVAPERQAADADRRAHGRAEQAAQHDELEDVLSAVESAAAVREEPHELGAQTSLEGVADRDAERGEDRSGRGEVHEKRADENGGPDPRSQQQERRERDPGGRPHR